MKRTFFLFLAFFALFPFPLHRIVAADTETELQDIRLTAELTTTTIRFGEPFELVVSVTWKGEPGEIQVDPPAKIPLEGLEMLGNSTVNRTTMAGDLRKVTREYRYRIRPTKEGSATIGSLSVVCRRPGPPDAAESAAAATDTPRTTLATSPLVITVLPPPTPLNIPWTGVISGFGLLIFGGIFWFYLRRKRGLERPDAAESDSLSPLERLKADIESGERLLLEGDVKGYYYLLEKTMLQFLTEQTKHRPGGGLASWTSFLQDVVGCSDEELRVFESFCAVNDLVKFGGHQPNEDEIRRQTRSLLRLAANVKHDDGVQETEKPGA